MEEKYCVHLIVEGFEEEKFFEVVRAFGVNENIKLTVQNADGAHKIGGKYQDAISNDEYDIVLCVYDVDYKYSIKDSAFNYVMNELVEITGCSLDAMKISYCNNPNILIWFLVGTEKVSDMEFVYASKPKNTKALHNHWEEIGKGIEKDTTYKTYEARDYQLNIMRDSYLYGHYSYDKILSNGVEFDTDLKSSSMSSTMYKLLEALKIGDKKYFESLKEKNNDKPNTSRKRKN